MKNSDIQIENVLTRGVASIMPNKNGLAELMRRKSILLYQGFDPSAASLHLGNYVGLMKLRQFQQLGHQVIFLVGDFTGMIGDPTDKLATRKKLTREQVLSNCKIWKAQVSRVLNFSGNNPARILFNSAWCDKLTFKDLIEVTSNFTVQQMLERDMYQLRLKEEKPIYLHEFLYPVAQAIDCVEMNVDLEIGGSDQLFNMMTGRTLMKALKKRDKYVLGTKLLVDKDGMKVGKTTGNALFLDSTPENFYSGIMSFPDEVIFLGYELLTEIDLSGISEKISDDPMREKKNLAYEVVKILWGETNAKKAQKHFEDTFQKREINDATEIHAASVEDLIAQNIVSSKSEWKRLINQGAVECDGQKLTDSNILQPGTYRIGKKTFLRII